MTGTPSIETQLAEAQAEATRLREHNATLLHEKKQLAKDYAKLQDDHAVATATLQRLQLDGPADALVESISTAPKLFKALWAEAHKFALDEQGRPCVQTLDGKPVMVKGADGNESPLPFDGKAIADYLCPRDTKCRGAYFADVLDENRVAVEPWRYIPDEWPVWLAHDFGSAAPSVTYLLAESPGDTGPDGRWYPRGSIVAIDELATNRSDDRLNEGIGWTVPVLADAIKAMCARWKISPHGVADDAIFAKTGSGAGCIADEFSREGIYFDPAQKGDRVSGWQRMRRLLSDASKPDRPGLYVSRACRYWWLTAPYAGRDMKRPEDVDSAGADHALDAMRYGVHRIDWASDIRVEWRR